MAEEEKKKPNLKLIIGGVIALVAVVGISSFMTSYLVSQNIDGGKSTSAATEALPQSGPMVEMGEFTTNLEGNEGANYIKVKITFEVTDEDVVKEVNDKAPMMDHIINNVLRGKSKEELNAKDSMDKLAQLLKKNLNQKLTDGRIIDIYFPSFIVS